MIYLKIKRILDIILSLIGLIVLSPVFLILIIAIKVDTRGPVLFKQKRLTKGKKEFYIYKFRTMSIDTPTDTPTHLLNNADSCITKFGKFLRKLSLDELPQMINILKGEMTIIGPRPALWNQYDLIAERDKYRANDIRPGLTGLAQINGRDELPIEIKAKLDGEYVQKMNFRLDVKCFFGTIASVLKHDGVVEGGTGALGHEETAAPKDSVSTVQSIEHCLQLERMYRAYLNLENIEHTDAVLAQFIQEYSEKICTDHGDINYVDGKIQCNVHLRDEDDDDGPVPFL